MPCSPLHRVSADDSAPVTTTLHIDCPTGLAGDMLLAALLDLDVPRVVVEEPLAALGLSDLYRLTVEEGRSGGLRGKRLTVTGLDPSPPHRHWSGIRHQIQASKLSKPLQNRVLAVFKAMADAEATVHGVTSDQVHFHEIGAIDALVDVVGVCAAVQHLNPVAISCTPPPAGWGTVVTAHGVLPVPVPAVLELARRHRIPLHQVASIPSGELTTPTGLALMAVLAERFCAPEVLLPTAIGVGLGHKDLDRPNLLRICFSAAPNPSANSPDREPRWQPLVVQEAWIDDATPEDVAVLQQRLREAGALDVAVQALQMKKGRTGQAVTVLVAPDQAAALRDIWFLDGSSIGLRERRQGRWLLPRRTGWFVTPWGKVRAKQVRRPDGRCTAKPEADDLQVISRKTGRPVDQLRAELVAAPFESEETWD